jgi:hypothetical protein
MSRIYKTFALLLTLIMVMSSLTLLTVKPANAQIIPKPSVPQFTLQLVGPPFIQNTTYSLNPDTGQIEPNIGYTNKYSYLVIVVKSQQFDSQYGSIYYNVTVNGVPFIRNGDSEVQYPEQLAGSDTTTITFSIFGGWGYGSIVGQQVSIQVQAMLGYDQWGRTLAFASQGYYFSGTVGDLSDPQIISVPANVPLSSPSTSTPTPSSSPPSTFPPSSTSSGSQSASFWLIVSAISFVVIAILLAVIVALLLIMRHRKGVTGIRM